MWNIFDESIGNPRLCAEDVVRRSEDGFNRDEISVIGFAEVIFFKLFLISGKGLRNRIGL